MPVSKPTLVEVPIPAEASAEPITLETLSFQLDSLRTDFEGHELKQEARDADQDERIAKAATMAAEGALKRGGMWGAALVFLVGSVDQWGPPLFRVIIQAFGE